MEITQEEITAQLGIAIAKALKEGDSVALPGFGTFSISKVEDHLETVDDVTYLYPPKLSVAFTPAIKFAKALKEKEISYE